MSDYQPTPPVRAATLPARIVRRRDTLFYLSMDHNGFDSDILSHRQFAVRYCSYGHACTIKESGRKTA
ncbi:MAG: hypothetical protein O3A13_11205 [Proteobacteria bacterium]|nr:hypothetical protein [Pseudomonadota bacterium]